MRNKISHKILLILLFVILIVSLSACSKIPGFNLQQIKKVDLKTSDAMILQEDGCFHMALNSIAYIYVDWNNIQVENPDIKWYKKEGANPFVEIKDKTKQLYLDTSKIYLDGLSLYAEVNGVKSNEIKIIVDFATLTTDTIKSTNYNIQNKRIQILQKDIKADSIIINLESSYNIEFINPEISYKPCWFIDGRKVKDGNDIDVEIIKLDDSEIQRDINVSYRVYENDSEYKESKLTISLIRDYDAIESIELGVKGATDIKDDLSAYNFVVLDDFKDFNDVTISVDTYPLNARLYSSVRWRLRTETEDKILDDKDREVTFVPEHGKNTISVIIENVRSYQVIIYALSSKELSLYDKVIRDQFYWDGNWNDQYISDQLDLNYSVANLMAKHTIGLKQQVYLARDNWVSNGKVTESFTYFGKYRKGALEYAVLDCGEAGSYRLEADPSAYWFVSGTIFSKAEEPIETEYIITQDDKVQPKHYSKGQTRLQQYNLQKDLPISEQNILPIDKCEEILVTSSDMLFRMASWGYKPVFNNDAEGKKLEKIYRAARKVLCEIIDDTMNEVEKVYAIYEWIIYNIEYDFKVVEDDIMQQPNSSRYYAFYLEGVFLDRRAVCDGRAKAVTLMCSMEGIKSIRVIGEAHGPFGINMGGHAWNKVFIDPNGDGIREWYVVDTTWGDNPQNKKMDSGIALKYEIIETLNYNYIFKRDSDLKTHVITMHDCPKADTIFKYVKG